MSVSVNKYIIEWFYIHIQPNIQSFPENVLEMHFPAIWRSKNQTF